MCQVRVRVFCAVADAVLGCPRTRHVTAAAWSGPWVDRLEALLISAIMRSAG